MKLFCLTITLVVGFIEVNGHGCLYEPPARQAMYLFGYDTPKDFNPMGRQCGYFNADEHGCSACGQPDMECPGGEFCKNIITRTYKAGSTIPVTIGMGANHGGVMRFSVCPSSNGAATWDCLDKNKLKITEALKDKNSKGGIIYQEPNAQDHTGGNLTFHVALPNIKCDRCVFQWHWSGAINYGKCANGTEGMGCGPQQTYINCADIKLQ